MPFKNGLQVIDEVKQYYMSQSLSRQVNLPTFVLLTAFATPVFKKHALANGVEHVFEKPIDI